MVEKDKRVRKPYEKPIATRLTAETAKLKLMGYAMMGRQGAKDLLELIFDNSPQANSRSAEESRTR